MQTMLFYQMRLFLTVYQIKLSGIDTCSIMDALWQWINITLFISDSMFTTILRLGPLTILEIMLLISAFIIYTFQDFPKCYSLTLASLAFIVFLIEMFASLRIMKNNSRLRNKYIKNRIAQDNYRFYCRLVWDNLNILIVIMLLYTSLIADGIQLQSKSTQFNSKNEKDEDQCDFNSFSLCLFSQLVKQCKFKTEDFMIMWMLYAVTVFLVSVLCIVVSKEYFQYCSSLNQNRKLSRQFENMNQTLLDCKVYRISQQTTITNDIRQQLGQCPICLHGILDKNNSGELQIIRLKCHHHFHQECINKWLKVKDHCPYRCFIEDN